MSKRAVVAMSGGVDSTVAAWLMKQQGYDITAVNLQMHPGVPVDETLVESCRMMDIPLVIRDCQEAFFNRVLLPGAQEYASGRTPNPCCECNAVLKFYELFAAADELNIKTVVTGHYAALVTQSDGTVKLGSAKDRNKDQSYFLYRLTGSELERCCFPLGNLTKAEVRTIAAEAGLVCASRPDSQDACFQIPGECCGDTLSRRCKVCGKQGRFIYKGKTVGRHTGIHRYTIGQRQGLGVALGVPAYIKSINARKGDIELCTDPKELECSRFRIIRTNWQHGVPGVDCKMQIKVRYRTPSAGGFFTAESENSGIVTLELPQRAVTPGQAAVFYDPDGFLSGGGVIELLPEVDAATLENSQPQ